MPVYITESGYLTEVKCSYHLTQINIQNDDVFDKVDKQLTKQIWRRRILSIWDIQFNFKKDWTTENGFVYLLN